MKTCQSSWNAESGWAPGSLNGLTSPDLVLVFGGYGVLEGGQQVREVLDAYPGARVLGCSTAGEIAGTRVHDDSLVATAIDFERTHIEQVSGALSESGGDSFAIGQRLAAKLDPNDLTHVFVLSDGLNVNGSQLVEGLTSELPDGVTVTGGLSGDGGAFERTLVLDREGVASDRVAALGLYGDIKVGSASLGGWDPFGPERTITRSEGNVLFELDGTSALELYKRYLGEHADGLPATGLLFPMTIRTEGQEVPVVRTILGTDDEAGSLTFAGDIPQGALGRLMKANFERLVDGAAGAARESYTAIGDMQAELGILISCVGRKMVLKQRIEEEVEAVRDVLGSDATLTGFYSYGEISPFTPTAKCELHNQTMTVTTLSER